MGHTLLIAIVSPPAGFRQSDHRISRSLKSPYHAGRKPEAVLAVACAGRKPRRQRVDAIEVRANKIDLRRADSKVARQSDIHSAAKGHGERVSAGNRS